MDQTFQAYIVGIWSFRNFLIFPFWLSWFHISLNWDERCTKSFHQVLPVFVAPHKKLMKSDFTSDLISDFVEIFQVPINSPRLRGNNLLPRMDVDNLSNVSDLLRFLFYWQLEFSFKTGSLICFPVKLGQSSVCLGALLTSFAIYPRSVSVYQSRKVSFSDKELW